MGKERLQLGKERKGCNWERKGCNCERFHQFWERFLSQERSSLQLGKVSSILVSFPSFPFPEWSKRKVGKVKGKDSDPPYVCLYRNIRFHYFQTFITRPNLESSGHCCAVSCRVPRAEMRERGAVKKHQNDVSMARKFKTVIDIISTAMYLKLR